MSVAFQLSPTIAASAENGSYIIAFEQEFPSNAGTNAFSLFDDSVSGQSVFFPEKYLLEPHLSVATCNGGNERTPMFILSEITRFNKIRHEYRLVHESGPAHDKVFTVSLTLTEDEVYTASGSSIKKAQQEAARQALEQTSLKRPGKISSKKYARQHSVPGNHVERLSQAAAKLNLNLTYFPPVPTRNPIYAPFSSPPFDSGYSAQLYGSFYGPTVSQPSRRDLHYATLALDGRTFVGVGATFHKAKEAAAAKALSYLNTFAQQECRARSSSSHALALSNVHNNHANPHGRHNRSQKSKESMITTNDALPLTGQHDVTYAQCEAARVDVDIQPSLMVNGALQKRNVLEKSPISLLHEIAVKKKLNVTFEVISDDGPHHNKEFVMVCCLSDDRSQCVFTAHGKGSNKQTARRDCCEKMLAILDNENHSFLECARDCTSDRSAERRLRRSSIAKQLLDPNYGDHINPVSRLIQVQQAKEAKEPVFRFLREVGHARCREFFVEVAVDDLVCEGMGPNKKLAKRAAAEMALEKLGLSKPLPKPGKPLLKGTPHCDLATTDVGKPAPQTDSVAVSADASSRESDGDALAECENEFAAEADAEATTCCSVRTRKVKFSLDNITTVRERELRSTSSDDFRLSRRSGANRRVVSGKKQQQQGASTPVNVFTLPSMANPPPPIMTLPTVSSQNSFVQLVPLSSAFGVASADLSHLSNLLQHRCHVVDSNPVQDCPRSASSEGVKDEEKATAVLRQLLSIANSNNSVGDLPDAQQ